MARQLMSKQRAGAIGTALFLVGLAIIAFTDSWWPGIMLVIGIPHAFRQFLLGRLHDMFVSLIVFVGFFIISQFNIPWRILLPIIFVISALYIISREFLDSYKHPEEEDEQDLNQEFAERRRPPRKKKK